MRTLGFAVLVVILAATPARADTPDAPPTVADQPDPSVATAYSTVPTVLGVGALVASNLLIWQSSNHNNHAGAGVALGALGATALIVGPAFGHVYAHDRWKRGAVIRGLSTTVAAVGLYALDECNDTFQVNLSTAGASCKGPVLLGLAIYIGGTAALVASAIHDTATAHRAAVEHGPSIMPTMTPVATPTGTAPGIGLVGRF